MTPKEKAESGLLLLKEATLEYLATRPQGVSSREAREALGLDSADIEGQRKGYLFWGLHLLLENEGKVVKRLIDGHRLLFLARQPEPKA
jgi:hypothetical protein